MAAQNPAPKNPRPNLQLKKFGTVLLKAAFAAFFICGDNAAWYLEGNADLFDQADDSKAQQGKKPQYA
jgi:hypothetical protein